MKRIFILLIALIFLLMPVYVYAIADPDSPPQVTAVYIYEDLLEDADCGVLIDYYLDYAVTPDETATEAYMASFIDTDGTTQLGTVAPYSFDTKGYGRGLIWIYFSAADVVTYSIDRTDMALYSVWLMGNPTVPSGWVGDPPKTTANIDYWQDGGDTAVLFALRILELADELELAWSEDLIEATVSGNRLTATGEEYFTNVVASLRTIAPNCFASVTIEPTQEDLDYTTEFGATMTNGTGTVVGSPITLAEGANTCNVTVAGTFILELEKGTYGTAASVGGGGTVTGSPVELVSGTNTITVPGGGTGNILVTVNLVNTQSVITDTITGTGLDLTDVATAFGMSRLMFSGLVWMLMSVLICGALWKSTRNRGVFDAGGGGKAVMIVFDICIIAGAVLGLLSILVAALMFIIFGIITGFVLFYKPANF